MLFHLFCCKKFNLKHCFTFYFTDILGICFQFKKFLTCFHCFLDFLRTSFYVKLFWCTGCLHGKNTCKNCMIFLRCGVPQIMTSRFRYLLLAIFIIACIITGAAKSMSGGIFLFTIVFLCFVVIGDLGYSRFLADKVFELNDDEVCPGR